MRLLLISFLLCIGLASCSSGVRFLNFGWDSMRPEISDTLRAHGFTFNERKARWEDGSLFGFECKRVRVWYDSLGYMTMAEAKFEDIDSVTSVKIYSYLLQKTMAEHSDPTITENERGSIVMDRRIWMFGESKDHLFEQIVLTRFNDLVIYNVSSQSPEPYNQALHK